ncbi:MAG: hypothetical protein VYB61_09985 [Verrucomicrobiota bacterium]|nr:hypothetical protein [Verrucomicrobiota bacterium]
MANKSRTRGKRSSGGRLRRTGVALVTTMFLLAALTILTIGFIGSMSVESGASGSIQDAQRTKMIAQGAVSHAIDLLRTNIPPPAPINEVEAPFNLVQEEISGTQSRPFSIQANSAPVTSVNHWVVNPGRLTIIGNGGGVTHVPLHSGEVTADPQGEATRDAESVDLNEPLPGEVLPPIVVDGESGYGSSSNSRPEMRVRWMPVFDDPGQRPGKDNPMVGRYAFWMDDESTKLNFNVALGKPSPREDRAFHQMVRMGMVTPMFYRGDGATTFNERRNRRPWSLGHPRSVNLDVLFNSPRELDHNRLLAHSWLHGFSRYMEAILDFVNVPDPELWLNRQRFNLTFYSRAPEFNVFGKSRLFTTNYPLSLEAGPLYQQPFMVNPDGDRVLHLHSLMGSFGFTRRFQDENGGSVLAGNMVNRAQLEMLMRYMSRKWPGYGASFVDKYGERECFQIALNMLLMARMATTTMGNELQPFSSSYSLRTTSVNYAPHQQEMRGNTPERMYWRFNTGGKEVLMLPQTPGPHIMEVRLIFEPEPGPNPGEYYITYRYETEYYMPSFGPVVRAEHFPTRVDYLRIRSSGAGVRNEQEFGARTPADRHGSRNWNHARSLGQLIARPSGNIGPSNATLRGSAVNQRIIASSVPQVIGRERRFIPVENAEKLVFRAALGSKVRLSYKIRLGMGVQPDLQRAGSGAGRPRQMIPLGETESDTLSGDAIIDLLSGEPLVLAWEIADPRLSGMVSSWVLDTDDTDGEFGSPGEKNSIEPVEGSPEKSKYKYIQRGPSGMRISGHQYNRNDEYNSKSRTSSKGYWSVIHTGMQSGVPWRTWDLGPSGKQDNPPDWLLLELLGATYPMQHANWRIDNTLPDSFSTVSYMNSTAGQVNVNSRIYPRSRWFNVPERRKPLEGVFKHLRSNSEVDKFIDGIMAHQKDNEVFEFIGELANVEGFENGEDPWKAESFLRDMAGCLTTQSNTFGLWGVAQTVKKVRSNREYDRFEQGDRVLGEKRFFAIIERYIWPGKDGVPGNAHLNSSGKWDRMAFPGSNISLDENSTDRLFGLPGSPPLRRSGAAQTGHRLVLNIEGSYPEYDGPQAVGMDDFTRHSLGDVRYRGSSLEDAYNPPQPVIKYRVVYFKYLDK